MGRLIIAEKHSVAQAIAAALGGGKAEDGWIGCGADAVTWAQGHLVDLLTPDEYQDRGWDKWSMDALPLDPTGGWKWKVNRQRGADRQYRVVAGLLKSDAYDVLVNACDPDREGESIFHRIVSYAGTRKPMLRLWVASLEEDAIRDALDSMRSEDEYRGLAEAADIRAKADWLIGMNASRAYTLVYHRRMSVGRVQTPTLAMVADRDRPLLAIDLSVPRVIDHTCESMPMVSVRDVDALETVVERTRQEYAGEVVKVEALVSDAVASFSDWTRSRAAVEAITAIRAKAEAIREAEIERTLRKLSHLNERDRNIVRALASGITNKLLHQPVQALRGATSGPRAPV